MPNLLDLDRYIQRIRNADLRVTEPRLGILQVLLEKHGPFSAEEVHRHMKKKACDLATIYRSLASLEKARIIARCEFGDGTARYELSAQEGHHHHHHHVICKRCKKIEVLDDCELQEIDRFVERRGFTQVSHSLEFFGVCPGCRK